MSDSNSGTNGEEQTERNRRHIPTRTGLARSERQRKHTRLANGNLEAEYQGARKGGPFDPYRKQRQRAAEQAGEDDPDPRSDDLKETMERQTELLERLVAAQE